MAATIERRLMRLESMARPIDRGVSLDDLTPLIMANGSDVERMAWLRFLAIQPEARGWLMRDGLTQDEADQLIADTVCGVADSMIVNMALKCIPDDIWPAYEGVYQRAELHRQLHHPDENLSERT